MASTEKTKATTPTPTQLKNIRRIKVKAVCDFLRSRGESGFHGDVFKFFGLQRAAGWKAIKIVVERERNGEPEGSQGIEKRGRPRKILPEHVESGKALAEQWDREQRTWSWDDLALEISGGGMCGRTLRRHLKHVGFNKAFPVRKEPRVRKRNVSKRAKQAKEQSQQAPQPEPPVETLPLPVPYNNGQWMAQNFVPGPPMGYHAIHN